MAISYQKLKTVGGNKIRAFVRYKNERASRVFLNKTAAVKWASDVFLNMEQGNYQKRLNDKPLSKVLDIYLSSKAPSLKGTGLRNKELIIAAIKKDTISRQNVYDLTPQHIRQFQTRLEKGSLQPSTVRHYINTISVAINYYIELYAGNLVNPCNSVKRPKAHNPRTYKIEDSELRKILALLDEEDRACILLASITGMRRGEITTLTIKSFDWSKNLITVEAAYSKTGSTRLVPMTNALCNHLKAYMANRIDFYSKSPTTLTRHFKKAATDIGCGDYRFHDTRHHALTKLSEAKVHAREIQKVSGHKRLETLERYLHEAHDLVATINAAKGLNTPAMIQSNSKAKK